MVLNFFSACSGSVRRGICSALALTMIAQPVLACTTTVVTPGASADGSMMISHSDDNHLMDQSLIYVPARDWPEGSMRPVYATAAAVGELPRFNSLFWPRLADAERAPAYAHEGKERSIPVGFIPQVPHTFAYTDGNYGIMNEHGLMFGECTDGAFVQNEPEPGKRLFYSAELSRVALERCRTAREAVELMGELIETYGYYGTGETLPVGDGREAWIMEMAPSPEGTGGLWAARRVPDGEFFVAANELRIRELTPDDPDLIIGRDTIRIIEDAGWRVPEDKSQPVDWLRSVSKGEYNHPYYSLRRVWRAMSLAAPSADLPAWVEDGYTRAYPFAIKPDRKMTLEDLKNIHRDHYEGTEFDMTKGIAAGPFGSPERMYGPYEMKGDVGDPDQKMEGAWERPLSVFYIGFTSVCQVRPDLPAPLAATLWYSLNQPAESQFVPLAVGPLPKSYEYSNPRKFSFDDAWWVYELIAGYAQIKYSWMIKDIAERRSINERSSEELVASLDKELAELAVSNPAEAAARRSEALNANAEKMLEDWRGLFTMLVSKYAEGMVSEPGKPAQNVGYTKEWLDAANYRFGPTMYQKPSGAAE